MKKKLTIITLITEAQIFCAEQSKFQHFQFQLKININQILPLLGNVNKLLKVLNSDI